MAYQLFTFPLSAGVSDMEPFNRFLKEHRVIQVERHLVEAGSQPVWTFCVEYLETSDPVPSSPGRSKEGVDYKALLPPADFAVFARLREVESGGNELTEPNRVRIPFLCREAEDKVTLVRRVLVGIDRTFAADFSNRFYDSSHIRLPQTCQTTKPYKLKSPPNFVLYWQLPTPGR